MKPGYIIWANALVPVLMCGVLPPENLALTINKVFDQWSVWFAEFRPVAVAEGSVKVYGDDLICCAR